MIKMVTFAKRRNGMSVEDFQDYWLSSHAPKVKSYPGLRRYAVSLTLATGYGRGEPAYDGVAELWFDDMAAFENARESSEFANGVKDLVNFIDMESRGMILVDEHVVKDGPVPEAGVKNIEFVTQKAGMPRDDFQRYWREVHGPLAAKISVIRRYVQSHTRPELYENGGAPAYGGVAITWFDGTSDMRVSATLPEYEATRADEANFLGPDDLPFIITREHVIVG
jgi:uncharacterized protein (TIGR02118 family)